jgi:hypothetical protein
VIFFTFSTRAVSASSSGVRMSLENTEARRLRARPS